MNTKKAITSLLGGGVAVVAASFGGISLNNKISHNRKVNHFNGLADSFKAKRKDSLEKYYLPKWSDDALWKRQYERNKNADRIGTQNIKRPFQKIYPTVESMKEFCHKEATKDKDLTKCNPSEGWCDICARDETW